MDIKLRRALQHYQHTKSVISAYELLNQCYRLGTEIPQSFMPAYKEATDQLLEACQEFLMDSFAETAKDIPENAEDVECNDSGRIWWYWNHKALTYSFTCYITDTIDIHSTLENAQKRNKTYANPAVQDLVFDTLGSTQNLLSNLQKLIKPISFGLDKGDLQLGADFGFSFNLELTPHYLVTTESGAKFRVPKHSSYPDLDVLGDYGNYSEPDKVNSAIYYEEDDYGVERDSPIYFESQPAMWVFKPGNSYMYWAPTWEAMKHRLQTDLAGELESSIHHSVTITYVGDIPLFKLIDKI